MTRFRLPRADLPWSHGNPIRQAFERREAQIAAEWDASGRDVPEHSPGWLPSIALHDLIKSWDTGASTAPAADIGHDGEVPF